MSRDELKPCPFCGSPAELDDYSIYDRWGRVGVRQSQIYIRCSNQDCPVRPETWGYKRKGWAIRGWNKRVDGDA